MAHYLFNLSKWDRVGWQAQREQAAALLRLRMWGVDASEPHVAALAPGDAALIYLGPPEREFIGRAELASAVRDWTPSETQRYPGDTASGVLLGEVEEWDPPVPMQSVLPRIDPTGSNPYVQANAERGFQTGVIQITDREFEAVLALRAETPPSPG